jgi:hypothetical protein
MRRIILLIIALAFLIAAGPAPVHAVDNDSIESSVLSIIKHVTETLRKVYLT